MIQLVLNASVPVKICMILLLWMSVRSWATGIYLYQSLTKTKQSLLIVKGKKIAKKKLSELNSIQMMHTYQDYLNELSVTARISPYVGLIGTVFGVMHTLSLLSQHAMINMKIVGPGISEALVTTALGLCVAIPATVMHDICQQHLFQTEDHLMQSKDAV